MPFALTIETAADGSGRSIDSITYTDSVSIPLHAVVRDAKGKFVRTEPVTWESPQSTGYLSSNSGAGTTLVPTCEPGSETITVRSKNFPVKVVRLNVAYTATNSSGLKTWFRADSLRTSNGTPVSSWTDCSRNRVTITDGGVDDQTPLYSTTGINGAPAVLYNTVNDGVMDRHVPANSSIFDTTDEFTHFIVIKLGGFTPWLWDGIHLKLDGTSGWYFQFRQTNGYAYRIDTTAMTNQGFNFIGGVDSAPHIISGTYSPGVGRAYLDGVLQVENSAILHGAGISSTTTMNVMGPCRPGEPCYMGDFLFFDKALSDSDRSAIERYLGRKYGISVPQ